MRWGAGLFAGVTLAASGVEGIPSAQRQAALLDLLRQDCGSCHGMSLRGGLGPALLPEALIGKSDAVLIDTIIDGRSGTAMPPWRGIVAPDEAAWLVQQLRRNP